MCCLKPANTGCAMSERIIVECSAVESSTVPGIIGPAIKDNASCTTPSWCSMVCVYERWRLSWWLATRERVVKPSIAAEREPTVCVQFMIDRMGLQIICQHHINVSCFSQPQFDIVAINSGRNMLTKLMSVLGEWLWFCVLCTQRFRCWSWCNYLIMVVWQTSNGHQQHKHF